MSVQKCLIETWDHNFTYHRSLFAANLRDAQLSNRILFIWKFKGLRYLYHRFCTFWWSRWIFYIDRQYWKCDRTMNINKQPTSDWHLTLTVHWALTLEMIRIWNLDCFVYKQHTCLRKGEWLFGEVVDHVGIYMDLRQPRVSQHSTSVLFSHHCCVLSFRSLPENLCLGEVFFIILANWISLYGRLINQSLVLY